MGGGGGRVCAYVSVSMNVCVSVCACVRACVRACMCVYIYVCVSFSLKQSPDMWRRPR